MRDLNRALTDISVIREHLTLNTEFRGYGPATLAATGLLALATAAVQAVWFAEPPTSAHHSLLLWVAAAAMSLAAAGRISRSNPASLSRPVSRTWAPGASPRSAVCSHKVVI